MRTLHEYDDFGRQMEVRLFRHFSQHVYQPLIKKKKEQIEYFGKRSDFHQVLSLEKKDEKNNIISECVRHNLDAMKNNI